MKKPTPLNLTTLIELFLRKSEKLALTSLRDRIYLRNQLFLLLNLNPTTAPAVDETLVEQHSLAQLAEMIYLALDGNQAAALGETKEQIETRLINILLPLPSIIEAGFKTHLARDGIKDALDWYYQFSQNTNYIKTADIAKNQSWSSQTKFGELDITINLSKPEKDPLEIAKAKLIKPSANLYPKCLLCIENEGFAGSLNQPARHNHRMLELYLNAKPWYFQYSPYAYYPEHSILINPQHCDMVINEAMLATFFDFVDLVPHYLVGSNSDIPIVGGSILTHDHYQAGNYIFPIEKAEVKASYKLEILPNVTINHLRWPISTLQLIGIREDLTALSAIIIQSWYQYDNSELGIFSADEKGQRHNGITPILRKLAPNKYALYLLLRNNRTSAEHPEGIFHPHRELHHIKKENIGLIEAMGLAILPGRLASELAELKRLLLLNDKHSAVAELLFDDSLIKHEQWLLELYKKYASFSANDTLNILKQEVANKFSQVLECSGVFKDNPDGDRELSKFINSLK